MENPQEFARIGEWSERTGATLDEGRRRYVQFVVLAAIAQSRTLRTSLVFKGGNALDFVWQPNRSTIDLDFSLDPASTTFPLDGDSIAQLFATALGVVGRRHAVTFAVHSVRQSPPGPDATFPTWMVRLGYALPDQFALLERMRRGRTSNQVVPVEISVNDAIVHHTSVSLVADVPDLRISTLEDIVGEKL